MARRLAAVLAADVVGYSRLMGEDEAGTLAALQAHRKDLIDPTIAQHDGRLVKLMGDGALVEFASAVDAVDCAVALQKGLAKRNEAIPESRRIVFRIGINIGDLIVEGDDLYGDGVNIAARLEGLAQPGGICVSRNVVSQVKGKVEADFEDLGAQTVKNIAEPVHAFRVTTGPPGGSTVKVPSRPKPWRRPLLAAVALLVAVLAGLAVWQRPWEPGQEPGAVDPVALPLPDKPSIAVLPFNNMSDDPGQEYFVDGMTEDLITDLSKISGLFVIARNSSFSYKGQSPEIQKVARDLGVRYVLEGSVRRAGDQVRINAQLIDATTGGHLWAERYDGSLEDIFALQDQVTRNIVAALAVSLTGEEQVRQARHDTENAEAHDAFLQGWEYYRRHTPRDFAKAIPYFERAVQLDPNYSRAYSALALVYWKSVRQGYPWTRIVSPDPSDFVTFITAQSKAEENTKRALNNPSPLAYQVSSGLRWTYRQFDDAVADARQAVTLDPNDPDGHVALAWALIFDGQTEAALAAVERAMRLDPDHPQDYLYVLGMAKFGLGQFEHALTALQGAQEWSPEFRSVNVPLAASYAQLDRRQEAKDAFARYWEEWTFSANKLDDILGWWPYRQESDMRRLGDGLIMAGVGSQEVLDDYVAQVRLGGTLQ